MHEHGSGPLRQNHLQVSPRDRFGDPTVSRNGCWNRFLVTIRWGTECGSQPALLALTVLSGRQSSKQTDTSGWWLRAPYFITVCGEVLDKPSLQEFAFKEVTLRLLSFMLGFTMFTMGRLLLVISAIFSSFLSSYMNPGPVIWCCVALTAVHSVSGLRASFSMLAYVRIQFFGGYIADNIFGGYITSL